jgi:hypothetical protein
MCFVGRRPNARSMPERKETQNRPDAGEVNGAVKMTQEMSVIFDRSQPFHVIEIRAI